MMQEFLDWSEKIKPEVSHVSGILSEKLSDEPEKLIADLSDAECWNSRMGALLAQANAWLDRYTYLLMPEKAEGKSEADRRAKVEHDVSPIRLLRDTLDSLCGSIKQRLILGEACLAYYRQQYNDRKARDKEVAFAPF